MRFRRPKAFANAIALLLTIFAAVGAASASPPHVEFTSYRRFLDNGIFRITNHSTKVIELDGMFPFDSGYPFEPAYASLEYLSDSFPVRKISATDIDFRQFGTDDESVLFRIQNNGETAILLPAMELKNNADVPFGVAEFEVQKQGSANWTQGLKVGFGAGNDYRISMSAKETLIFKVPKASFGDLLNGSILRLKVGDFVTRPFRIREPGKTP